MSLKHLKECLVCGNTLKVYCDLGEMPLVNNLKESPEQEDIKYPLVVMECSCTHKQLSVAVDRGLLFKDYLYQTGASASHIEYFMDFAWKIDLPRGNILDIGCNDGSLLSEFKARDWKCLGIEPSKELCNICKQVEGIKVVNDYFPSIKIRGKFDIITAFNVFAHNDNPRLFLEEMGKLLKPEGRIYILTTPARLDNFYHEHISYFTPQSMMVLASKCGLDVVSFKTVSMHGESYLFEVAKKKEIVKLEYVGISRSKIDTHCVAYGASASETVLFNHFQIKPEYVVEDNPLKQGKFIPGINSPIVSAEHIAKDPRNLSIIVCHNLANEITEKIKKLRPNKKDHIMRLI